jgi:hypothetical protein
MMRHWRKRTGERGAVAIIVAISMVLLMAAAAVGVDIARLAYERQQLQNALDAAAAAGVVKLPDSPADAIREAQKFAKENMEGANLGSIVPSVALRCVTSYNTTTKSPDWATVQAVCNISSRSFTALDCNEEAGICSVPCTVTDKCNTIVVKYNKAVDFTFGPAIGMATGETGSIVSAACRGYCGTVRPNPMDVVVMADRTPSMKDGFTTTDPVTGKQYTTPTGSFTNMKSGIQDMLGSMNQDQQYVAFGTIAISWPTDTNKVAEPSGGNAFTDATYVTCTGSGTKKKCTPAWTAGTQKVHFKGSWVPIEFTNNYTKADAYGLTSLDTTKTLGKSVGQLEISDGTVYYPDASDGVKVTSPTNEGTHLAAALKGAVRYLVNTDPVKDLGLPKRPEEYGVPQKVIIFETDGSPSEILSSDPTALTLDNDLDIGYSGNGQKKSCENFTAIANFAKAKGIRLITIGVGAVNAATCGTSGGTTIWVRDVLAAAASPTKAGKPSDAYDCTKAGKTEDENSDGDNYFCAATSADLKGVFLAAMGSLNEKSTLMRLPNADAFANFS